MTLEPLYIVDTHALIWYLTDDRKLGKQASAIFAAAERGETQLVVSAIVVAEMYYANKKNN
jgi:PIN domain nuclease of toxin-antitoxin system